MLLFILFIFLTFSIVIFCKPRSIEEPSKRDLPSKRELPSTPQPHIVSIQVDKIGVDDSALDKTQTRSERSAHKTKPTSAITILAAPTTKPKVVSTTKTAQTPGVTKSSSKNEAETGSKMSFYLNKEVNGNQKNEMSKYISNGKEDGTQKTIISGEINENDDDTIQDAPSIKQRTSFKGLSAENEHDLIEKEHAGTPTTSKSKGKSMEKTLTVSPNSKKEK